MKGSNLPLKKPKNFSLLHPLVYFNRRRGRFPLARSASRWIRPIRRFSHRRKIRQKPRIRWIIVVVPVKILEDRTTRGRTDDRHSKNASGSGPAPQGSQLQVQRRIRFDATTSVHLLPDRHGWSFGYRPWGGARKSRA